jgi:hypothetical protein
LRKGFENSLIKQGSGFVDHIEKREGFGQMKGNPILKF